MELSALTALSPLDGRYTYNKETNTLYLHLMNWPFKHVHLPGLYGKIAYAQLLHDGSEIKIVSSPSAPSNVTAQSPAQAETLLLPVNKPDVEVPVIELFLK